MNAPKLTIRNNKADIGNEKYDIVCDIGCRGFLEKYNIPFHVINKGKDTEEKFNKLIDF